MPFSFLDRDALDVLYGDSKDGIVFERFDQPIREAELQARNPSSLLPGASQVVYVNPTFYDQARSIGLELEKLEDAEAQTAISEFFDSHFNFQWQDRPRTRIDNLPLTPHIKSGGQHLPPLILSTTPIKHNGYVHGCRSRVTDASSALKRDLEERRALQQIEAFVRTENVPLICLQFATPIATPLTNGELGAAYVNSIVTHVTDSAAELFDEASANLVGKNLAAIDNHRIAALLSNSFPADTLNESISLGDTTELLVRGPKTEQVLFRVKPTFIYDNSMAIEAWLRIEDDTEKQRHANHQATLEQTRNLALEAASLYQFEIDPNTRELNIDDTGLVAMGLTNMPSNLAGWLKLLRTTSLNITHEELRHQYSRDPKQINFIACLKNDDGEDRYLEIWGNINTDRKHGNADHRTLGLYRDVTQTESLNARLRDKKTLESLGVLAGGVAHDFNNLLMSVLGYAELMEADVLEEPEHDRSPLMQSALHNISEIRAAALSASELCTSLLAYAGQHLIEKKSIDLTDLVRTTTDLLQVSIGKRVPILLNLDNEVIIEADKGQLTQVIVNLVGNAADAMENQRGAIQISIDTCVLTPDEQQRLDSQVIEPGERLACLTVRDSGIGMSSETLKRMYEPFFTTKTEGRGLGMAAVHGIVKNHGGGILVESSEGKGTEFRVCFPLLARLPTSEHSISSLTAVTAKVSPSVLVVDDEPGVRKIAAEMLRHLDCEVHEAESAESALALFATHRFDHILLDITMPVMSGSELAELLLERVPGVNVVLCSGYTDKNVPSALLKRCTFIHKPYTLKEVSDALNLESETTTKTLVTS